MASIAYNANISLTRFDFHGCGSSVGRIIDSVLSQRIADLRAVIDYLRETYYRPHICLFGSSFGGMTAIMVSAADSDIKALAVMSTPYSIDQDLGLGETFRNDLWQYDVLTAIEQAPPLLIMHGKRDKLVSVDQAKRCSLELLKKSSSKYLILTTRLLMNSRVNRPLQPRLNGALSILTDTI